MLTVTPAARDRLSKKLAERKAAEDTALRFLRREHGWSLRPDRVRPTDATFTHEGRNVLLLDKSVAKAMSNRTLDTRPTQAGPRLMLT